VKLIVAIALLIGFALFALAYLRLNPILTFVLVSVGLYLFSRKGDDSLWPRSLADYTWGYVVVFLPRADKAVDDEPDSTADKDRRKAERR
jgi:H+/gluconate symporter-like permease